MAKEDLALFTVDEVRELGEFAKENLEVVASFLYRSLGGARENIFAIFEHIFWRNLRNINTWPAENQLFVEEREVVVAACNFKRPFIILSFYVICHSRIYNMRIGYCKVFLH